ncbi:hypothetical protein ACKS0A_01640 [Histoplasma ohiense]
MIPGQDSLRDWTDILTFPSLSSLLTGSSSYMRHFSSKPELGTLATIQWESQTGSTFFGIVRVRNTRSGSCLLRRGRSEVRWARTKGSADKVRISAIGRLDAR